MKARKLEHDRPPTPSQRKTENQQHRCSNFCGVYCNPAVDGRNPAWPYIDLIYQKYRKSGSIEQIYIYDMYTDVHEVMQDFYHQQ